MRCVALLRGINVGQKNRIGMPALTATFEQLGHTGVVTHVQSGNVVFDTRRSPARIEQELTAALLAEHGLTVPVLVRTGAELAAAVTANPLETGPDPKLFAVLFCSGTPDAEVVSTIDPRKFEPERFAVVGREIYLRMPGGTHNSRLTQTFWERRLKLVVTARNWNTVLALQGLSRSS